MQYLAYGSNMDVLEMSAAKVRFSKRVHGVVGGYELRFNKLATKDAQEGEGKGNIVKNENDAVEGALYEIRDSDLRNLDRKEGYPNHYDRITVSVTLDHHTRTEAITYIAQPWMTREGLKPTRKYLNHYLAARDILSEAYVQRLSRVETLD